MTKNRVVKIGDRYYPQWRAWWWPFWSNYEGDMGGTVWRNTLAEAVEYAMRPDPEKTVYQPW